MPGLLFSRWVWRAPSKLTLVRRALERNYVHDLRRTAVRNLVRAGVPNKVAMTLTGHETRAVSDRYNIVNEADLNSAVTRLAAFHTGIRADGSDTFDIHGAAGRA